MANATAGLQRAVPQNINTSEILTNTSQMLNNSSEIGSNISQNFQNLQESVSRANVAVSGVVSNAQELGSSIIGAATNSSGVIPSASSSGSGITPIASASTFARAGVVPSAVSEAVIAEDMAFRERRNMQLDRQADRQERDQKIGRVDRLNNQKKRAKERSESDDADPFACPPAEGLDDVVVDEQIDDLKVTKKKSSTKSTPKRVKEVEQTREEEEADSTILINATISLGNGLAAPLKVRAVDRCKDVAKKFVAEHNLKPVFAAPLTAWLKEAEEAADVLPVVVTDFENRICARFSE